MKNPKTPKPHDLCINLELIFYVMNFNYPMNDSQTPERGHLVSSSPLGLVFIASRLFFSR